MPKWGLPLADGVVGEVLYGVGEQVGEGAQLLSFDAGNG